MPNWRRCHVPAFEPTPPPLEPMIERIGPLQPGDILVFRNFDDLPVTHEEIVETVIAHYRTIAVARNDPSLPTDAAYHVPLLVFPGPDGSIEHLDETMMRERGWVRA